MHLIHSLDNVAETLEHLSRHWAHRKYGTPAEAAGRHRLTIALSRETGTPGTAIGHAIGKKLGWPVFDHELVERIALDLGVHTELLKSVDERRVSWLAETMKSLMKVPYVPENTFVHRLVKTVLALGTHGESVIVGRGSAFILPPWSTLRVRLVAPAAWRIHKYSHHMHLSHEEAAREVDQLDRERNAFVREHFHKDPADSREYDVILNVERYSVDECAGLVIDALKNLHTRATKNYEKVTVTRNVPAMAEH